MSSTIQNLIVVLGLIVIAGLGYYLYNQNKESLLSSGNETVQSQAELESVDFLRKLNELKSLSLDGSIFTDPRFQSFVDREPPVVEEEVGRENPFLEVTE